MGDCTSMDACKDWNAEHDRGCIIFTMVAVTTSRCERVIKGLKGILWWWIDVK